mmetsp:Transcript_47870/g.121449  ORF Transcript_47870/g.121449 Transcript_47870/m.121449 type:complete len:140 (-) Transcript_47870:41-460(-)
MPPPTPPPLADPRRLLTSGSGVSVEEEPSALLSTTCSSSRRAGGNTKRVLMGSGIIKRLEAHGDTAISGGVRRPDASEEFVEDSQQPEEHRDEDMSPSRAMSREEHREDFPEREEPDRSDPAREAQPTRCTPPARLGWI